MLLVEDDAIGWEEKTLEEDEEDVERLTEEVEAVGFG
jgi:hypothetical protein